MSYTKSQPIHLIKTTIALLTALLLAPLTALQAAPPAQPNILHIHTDDHRPDGLRALGTPLLQTPNLDTLVERGMAFTRCYTMGSMQGAVCAPSRAMLLTGRSWLRIPRGRAAAANASDPSTFLPRVMAAAGYQTWHMGKAGDDIPMQIDGVQLDMRNGMQHGDTAQGTGGSAARHIAGRQQIRLFGPCGLQGRLGVADR